jgi:hypothetical protein
MGFECSATGWNVGGDVVFKVVLMDTESEVAIDKAADLALKFVGLGAVLWASGAKARLQRVLFALRDAVRVCKQHVTAPTTKVA